MRSSRTLICIAALCASLAGCSSSSNNAKPLTPADTAIRSGPAPSEFKASFDTSRGTFLVLVHRDWSPLDADRFYQLIKIGFFDGARFFRVVPGFIVQFGINGDPRIQEQWHEQNVPDDPVKEKNQRGTLAFAKAGPNTATTQIFINLGNNSGSLDPQGFSPFGGVVEGMSVVDNLYSGYGEQPQQPQIEGQGNQYLETNFPKLDYIKTAKIVP